MKAINVKTIEDCQHYCEGVLNDFESGIIDKSEALVAFWEYTVQIHNLFTGNLEAKVQERLAEIHKKEKDEVFYDWDLNAPEKP